MKAEYLVITIGALALLSWIWKRRGLGGKVIISSPKLGILNLKGVSAEALIAEDSSAIGSIFSGLETSTTISPRCDVLFVYCDFATDGKIVGTARNLREIISDSHARIVVIASENSGDSIVIAVKNLRPVYVNLAVTLQRKGAAFPSFYRRLFSSMAQGVTMPVAWNELAPQIPGSEHEGCPSGFFTAEASQVAFK